MQVTVGDAGGQDTTVSAGLVSHPRSVLAIRVSVPGGNLMTALWSRSRSIMAELYV